MMSSPDFWQVSIGDVLTIVSIIVIGIKGLVRLTSIDAKVEILWAFYVRSAQKSVSHPEIIRITPES